MIYRLRHVTRYAYENAVELASHVAHMRPRCFPGHVVLSARLGVDPAPARSIDGIDYFGNPVTWLFLEQPHDTFTVTPEATVDVEFPAPPLPHATRPWESITAAAGAVWEAAEFTGASPMVALEPEWWLERGSKAVMRLMLHLPHSVRPKDINDGQDGRELAFCCRSLCLRPIAS